MTMKGSMILVLIILAATLHVSTAKAHQLRGRRLTDGGGADDETHTVFPETFDFEMKISLKNGDMQCIEANIDDVGQAIMDAIKETESQMDQIVYEQTDILATGFQVLTEEEKAKEEKAKEEPVTTNELNEALAFGAAAPKEFMTEAVDSESSGVSSKGSKFKAKAKSKSKSSSSSSSDEDDRRRLRWGWSGSGSGSARLSYSDNSDGFIPGLGFGDESPLNFDVPALLSEQEAAMQALLQEDAEVMNDLANQQAKFDEKHKKLIENLNEKIAEIEKEKRGKSEKWYQNKKEAVDKLKSKIDEVVREFEMQQEEIRLKIVEKVAFLESNHEYELNMVTAAVEPVWRDFQLALESLARQGELNAEQRVQDLFSECFPGMYPDIELILTAVPPAHLSHLK